MMHGMTPIEHLDHPPRFQPDLGDNPIQPLPDPRRAIGHEGHYIGQGSTHPVQMKRDQLDQCVGALERAVDDGAASPNHAPLLVYFAKDDNLGLTPLDPELLPLRFAADANLFHNGSHSDPAAVYLGCDTLARELVAHGQFAGAESHQVTGAGVQHLRPQFTSDSPYRFLILFLTLPSQLRACLFDWQETDQAAHVGLYVGAATLTDPISRELGIQPTPLRTSSLASASTR